MSTMNCNPVTKNQSCCGLNVGSGTHVVFDDDVKKIIEDAVNVFEAIVCSTMGPAGSGVLVSNNEHSRAITKDGVTAAKNIKDIANPYLRAVMNILIQGSVRANDDVGDGTTTTASIIAGIMHHVLIVPNANPNAVCVGVQRAIKRVIQNLEELSVRVSLQKTKDVATLSANNDAEIGEEIYQAILSISGKNDGEDVGDSEFDFRNGVISIEEGNTAKPYESTKESGMQFDRGYVSPYFVTNKSKMSVEFDNPNLLIIEKKISNIQEIVPILEAAMRSAKPLIIIAEDFDDVVIATMVVNKLQNGLKVVAIKAPSFGDRRKEMLKDIAVMSGGQIISEETGMSLDSFTPEMFGNVRSAKVTNENTTIVARDDSDIQAAIASRIMEIDSEIESNDGNTYNLEKLRERRAKLGNGVVVIKVGGATEAEMKETKDRVEDALSATRAALEEGIVPGGGVAYMLAAKSLDDLLGDNESENVGITAVKKALFSPMSTIVRNAGFNSEVIANELCKKNESAKLSSEDVVIFDAYNCKYVNAFNAGIIDPAKVARIALRSAASVASVLLKTSVILVNKKADNEENNPQMMPGGMGGMGGGMF